MENTENNKLIADFLGFKKFNSKLPYIIYDIPQHKRELLSEEKGGALFSEMELKFNHDWNWLIPVIEKISNIKGFGNIENDLKYMKINSKIEDVYKSCLNFIKLYNQQKIK